MPLTLPEKLNAKQQKVAKPFLDFNIPMPDAVIEQIIGLGTPTKSIAPTPTLQSAATAREAEAVLASIWVPKSVQKKTCKNCKEVFQTTYIEAYCSNDCRATALLAIGIKWDPNKSDAERWAPTQIPGTIRPDTLKVLKEYARQILEIDDVAFGTEGNETVSERDYSMPDNNDGISGVELDNSKQQVEPEVPQPQHEAPDSLSELDSLLSTLGISD